MTVTTTVGQRFSELISHLGISKNAFANSLEKTATVIQHIVDERNKPGFDLLCKVFEVYPNVSKDWLLQGAGPMLAADALPGSGPKQAKSAAELKAGSYKTAVATLPTTSDPAPAPALSLARQPDPEPLAPAPVVAPVAVVPVVATPEPVAAPAPVEVLAPAPTLPSPAPAVADTSSWQTALYTQQMAHQLAMAELRNQHLLDQQRMMQQMLELMRQQMGK